jgi:hypothetical protein
MGTHLTEYFAKTGGKISEIKASVCVFASSKARYEYLNHQVVIKENNYQ